MGWNAKPSGGYSIDSTQARENMEVIYSQLIEQWSLEAVCGMLGNMVSESGLNPWRWQSDSVDLDSSTKGYGLAQFTPAYGYINNYGVGVEGFAPNLSTDIITPQANVSDGMAQISVINEDRAGKFIDRRSYCNYADISSTFPMASYKQSTDLYTATVGWLFNYEFPTDHSSSVADARYRNASMCYEILQGFIPPTPPHPPHNLRKKIPLYMYMRRVERR